jgi:hypothetical protein
MLLSRCSSATKKKYISWTRQKTTPSASTTILRGLRYGEKPARLSKWLFTKEQPIRDINTHETTPMDFKSNAFCASGMHFPNGSFVTFGGNGAIGPDGNIGSVFGDGTGAYDETYKDFDGGKAIRVIDPCTGSDAATNPNCQWFDDASVLAMKKRRWYSTAEALADGSVVLIGGFQQGSNNVRLSIST